MPDTTQDWRQEASAFINSIIDGFAGLQRRLVALDELEYAGEMIRYGELASNAGAALRCIIVGSQKVKAGEMTGAELDRACQIMKAGISWLGTADADEMGISVEELLETIRSES